MTKTGSLRVVLCATTDYNGSSWTGWPLGIYQFDSIDSGRCYLNKNVTAPRTSPPPGKYTIILKLEGFNGEKYVMRDHRVFGKTLDIYRQAKLEGSWYSCDGDSVSLYARRISHNFSAITGSLKLVLWACSEPLRDRRWNGYRIGEVQLDPLDVGKSYNEIIRKVSLTRPPTGSYYMIMELQSYEPDWLSRDHEMLKDKASF